MDNIKLYRLGRKYKMCSVCACCPSGEVRERCYENMQTIVIDSGTLVHSLLTKSNVGNSIRRILYKSPEGKVYSSLILDQDLVSAETIKLS